MGDRIVVPIEIEDLEVADTALIDGRIEVTIHSTLPRACWHCGSMDVVGHGTYRRRIRDCAYGYPTVLVWIQRRHKCHDCRRTSRERHPAFCGAKRITARFLQYLGGQAAAAPMTDIASRESVSWWRVSDAFEHTARDCGGYEGPPPRVISLDEAAFKKRHRYHTVISDPIAPGVVEMVDGRSPQTAHDALVRLPEAWHNSIETVVIDMFWPFRKAIEEVLPDVRVVADKFHVLRSVDAAANKVRVRYGRRRTVVGLQGGLARQNNPRFHPAVWRNRWTFAKRAGQLSDEQAATLDEIFTDRPEVGIAWWLKEAFAAIYQAPTRQAAEQRLDRWIHHIEVADIDEFTSLWRTLRYWRDPILNYFDDRHTNAYAEGITNKIKVIKRRGYGYRNPTRYRQLILTACGRRAEPDA